MPASVTPENISTTDDQRPTTDLTGGVKREAWGDFALRFTPYALLCTLILAATWKLTLGQRIIARGDLLLYFYPLRDYASQAVRAGHLPLWNPYTFMGAPFLANSQAGFFYPLNIALAWLPVAQQVSYSIVLHLVIATIGMYILARRGLQVGRLASLASAVTFGLSGYLGQQVEHLNQLQVLAWLPWQAEIVMRRAWSMRRGAWSVGREAQVISHQLDKWGFVSTGLVLSGLIALQILAGHTQSLYICLITLGIIALLNVVGQLMAPTPTLPRRSEATGEGAPPYHLINLPPFHLHRLIAAVRPLLILIAAATLAIVIASAQLLPTLELSRESYRNGGLTFGEAASFSWRPWLIARALLPTYGDPLFSEYVAYFGVAGLALALLGVGREAWGVGRGAWGVGRQACAPRPTLYALTLTALGFVLALGVVTPIFNVLYKLLPGFNLFRVQARWLIMFTLGVAMLVGLGTQALLDGLSTRQKRAWLFGWLGLMGLLAVGVWLGARISLDPEYRSLPARRVMWGWGIAAVAVTLAISVINLSHRRWLAALVPIGLIAELLIASQFQPYARAADAQAFTELRPSTAHLLAERSQEITSKEKSSMVNRQWSIVNGNRILALSGLFFDPGDMFEQRLIYTQTLSEDELYDRIITTKHKEILSPNLSLYYRLPSVDGYDGGLLPTRRFIDFASQFTPTPKSGTLDGRLREFLKAIPDNRWLEQMAVRYIIVDKTADVFYDGIYYDTLLSVNILGQMTLPLTPYTSTTLGLVFSGTQAAPGQLLARANIIFQDGAQTFDVRATDQVTQALWPVRLTWRTSRIPTHISLSEIKSASALTLRAITSIDSTDQSFLSQLPFFDYRLAVVHSGDVKIYENKNPAPRVLAYVSPGVAAEVQPIIIEDTPERVAIHLMPSSEGDKRSKSLVLRDACYPGWVARVDGVETPIRCADILFREIDLPPHAQQVVFSYEPRSVQIGLIVSAIGMVVWLVCLASSVKRQT